MGISKIKLTTFIFVFLLGLTLSGCGKSNKGTYTDALCDPTVTPVPGGVCSD